MNLPEGMSAEELIKLWQDNGGTHEEDGFEEGLEGDGLVEAILGLYDVGNEEGDTDGSADDSVGDTVPDVNDSGSDDTAEVVDANDGIDPNEKEAIEENLDADMVDTNDGVDMKEEDAIYEAIMAMPEGQRKALLDRCCEGEGGAEEEVVAEAPADPVKNEGRDLSALAKLVASRRFL